MKKKYTQVEARNMYHKILRLENQIQKMFSDWAADYPGGTHIATLKLAPSDVSVAAIHTARRLRHACVVTDRGTELNIYALPEPEINP